MRAVPGLHRLPRQKPRARLDRAVGVEAGRLRPQQRRRADAIGRELVAVREMLDAMRADYVALLRSGEHSDTETGERVSLHEEETK